ncbi:hypothetical protein FHW96_000306 [Novosphingobium sp. SG751A]|nr:hypothetical protein [Novosphingobium sp. SG751A]
MAMWLRVGSALRGKGMVEFRRGGAQCGPAV